MVVKNAVCLNSGWWIDEILGNSCCWLNLIGQTCCHPKGGQVNIATETRTWSWGVPIIVGGTRYFSILLWKFLYYFARKLFILLWVTLIRKYDVLCIDCFTHNKYLLPLCTLCDCYLHIRELNQWAALCKCTLTGSLFFIDTPHLFTTHVWFILFVCCVVGLIFVWSGKPAKQMLSPHLPHVCGVGASSRVAWSDPPGCIEMSLGWRYSQPAFPPPSNGGVAAIYGQCH